MKKNILYVELSSKPNVDIYGITVPMWKHELEKSSLLILCHEYSRWNWQGFWVYIKSILYGSKLLLWS